MVSTLFNISHDQGSQSIVLTYAETTLTNFFFGHLHLLDGGIWVTEHFPIWGTHTLGLKGITKECKR